MIPVLVVSSIAGLIGIIGGKTTIRYYNLTISENFFNLDHDRIQNDIEPSNEMSSARLLKEVRILQSMKIDILFLHSLTFYATLANSSFYTKR